MNTDNTNEPNGLDWDELWKVPPAATPGVCTECLEVVQLNLHADGCSEVSADERRAERLDMDVAELRRRVDVLSELVESHVGWHRA